MLPAQVDVAVVGSVNIDLVASVTRLPLPTAEQQEKKDDSER